MSELKGVFHQINEDLLQSDLVTQHGVGEVIINSVNELCSLKLRLISKHLVSIVEYLCQTERCLKQSEEAFFNLEHIKDVVHETVKQVGLELKHGCYFSQLRMLSLNFTRHLVLKLV